MVLGFKEYFNNDLKRPTYFREKILAVHPIILTVNPPITIRHLATNDGFDSVSDFLTYFNDHFTGQIVHWTNLKY